MFQPGLKGITAVETKLSNIDGARGLLTYRGIPVERLVEKYTFEEVAYFLLYGDFPDESQLETFINQLKRTRQLPLYIENILNLFPKEMQLMDVLRTVISAFCKDLGETEDSMATKLIATIPTIIAYRYRQMNSLTFIAPNQSLTHVENIVYMLTGEINKEHAKILETYLLLTMEHGLNASTFAARVTISTESDLISAITSALGTMKGPLHGGAPSGVIDLLEEIETSDNIREVIHKKLQKKERIMGFGHRVYKTYDPRAEALKKRIVEMEDLPNWIQLALETEQETIRILQRLKPNHRLYTNVEYYAAAIMKTLNIDVALFTAIFSSSRIVGWCAHALEQLENNTIFRPNALYVGQ
ncbi:citrate/2-methylcitrate synthase [Ornithinibacillus halotolerans]|uniref:Citrate synthase n=1 Tax=Ornithinibacillus halotolerans TaxID=1274357 RepID=A0A916RMI3_9BACI|nr:citrate/2-methylcitrate synthase [Ornithinibacillus halotolerans]GGA61908.1 citrate synthase 1 [Ornithinibacillus halotolerans]